MRDIAFRELKNLQAYQLTVKNLTARIRIINDSIDVLSEEERNILFLYATENIKDAIHTIRDMYGMTKQMPTEYEPKRLTSSLLPCSEREIRGRDLPAFLLVRHSRRDCTEICDKSHARENK